MDRTGFVLSSDFAIRHARVVGTGTGRSLVEDIFRPLSASDYVGPDEVLFIPRLYGKVGRRGGARLRAALIAARDTALVDPPILAGRNRALRFTSQIGFAVWLIGEVLTETGSAGAALALALTGQRSPATWWRKAILPDGRTFVALVARLADAELAARWLTRFDPIDIDLATGSISRDYNLVLPSKTGLPTPATPLDQSRVTGPPFTPLALPGGRNQWGEGVADRVAAVARLLVRDGNSFCALSRPAQLLLLAATVLAQAPASPRAALAEALDRWVPTPEPKSDAPSAAPQPAREEPRERIAVSAPSRPNAVGSSSAGSGSDRRIDGGSSDTPLDQPTVTPDRSVRSRLPAIVRAKPQVETTLPPPAAPTGAEVPIAAVSQPAKVEALHPSQTSAAPGSEVHARHDAAFQTQFGGLVFLLNAFLAMDFYPDFTRPLEKGLAIGPFALVDALGRHWFGRAYGADPMHRWLRGRDVAGWLPRHWRVPREWLLPFEGRTAWHRGRTLWHAAGFPLANGVGTVAAKQIARALGLRLTAAPAAGPLRNPRWLECLALFLVARLARASADGSLGWKDLALPAHCTVIGDKQVLHFQLDRLPLAIRFAGLDRDIGWLPAEGRDIRFSFA
jgi:hypothetical protein